MSPDALPRARGEVPPTDPMPIETLRAEMRREEALAKRRWLVIAAAAATALVCGAVVLATRT